MAGKHPQPQGRPPKGLVWNGETGEWDPDPLAVAAAAAATERAALAAKAEMPDWKGVAARGGQAAQAADQASDPSPAGSRADEETQRVGADGSPLAAAESAEERMWRHLHQLDPVAAAAAAALEPAAAAAAAAAAEAAATAAGSSLEALASASSALSAAEAASVTDSQYRWSDPQAEAAAAAAAVKMSMPPALASSTASADMHLGDAEKSALLSKYAGQGFEKSETKSDSRDLGGDPGAAVKRAHKQERATAAAADFKPNELRSGRAARVRKGATVAGPRSQLADEVATFCKFNRISQNDVGNWIGYSSAGKWSTKSPPQLDFQGWL